MAEEERGCNGRGWWGSREAIDGNGICVESSVTCNGVTKS